MSMVSCHSETFPFLSSICDTLREMMSYSSTKALHLIFSSSLYFLPIFFPYKYVNNGSMCTGVASVRSHIKH